MAQICEIARADTIKHEGEHGRGQYSRNILLLSEYAEADTL